MRLFSIVLVIMVVFGISMFVSSPLDALAANYTVSTDSPVYVAGDTITITGSIVLVNNDNLLTIEIDNPQGQPRLWQISSDSNGSFQTSYPLTENTWLSGGTFKVIIRQQNVVVSSTNFVLMSTNNVAIPQTMSDITKQWLLGKITDMEFLENVQFIINNHSLVLPIIAISPHIEPPIDDKFRNGAVSWVAKRTDDVSFAKSLSYLFNAGYLPVQITTDFTPYGSITTNPHSITSNTNVLLFIPIGSSQYDVGQIVSFRGQVLSKVGGAANGIPNAPYEIVDADTGQILTQGSTDNDGTFEFDWPAQSSGKSLRNIKAVFPGQGGFQMSESSTVKVAISGIISSSPTVTTPIPVPATPTTPKPSSSNPYVIPIPSENVVSPQLIPQNIGYVRIVSGTGDFSDLSSTTKSIRIHTGSQISGTIQLSVTNNLSSNANIPLILAYSWGSHQSSWQTILPSIQKGTSEHTVSVNLQTPQTGTYFLIFAFSGDSSGDYVASSTSDAVGQPSWNDGHDLVDLQSPQIAQVQQFGHTLRQEFTLNGYQPKDLAADAVIVNVIEAVPPIASPTVVPQQQTSLSQSSSVPDFSSLISTIIFFVIIAAIVLSIRKKMSKRQPPRPKPTIITTGPKVIQPTNLNPRNISTFTPPQTPTMPSGYTSQSHIISKTSQYTPQPNIVTSSPSIAKMPDHSDYVTAMNNLSKITKNQELKTASVVKRNNKPIFATGNFGGVYEVSINGKFYALKYFTRPKNDMENRYDKISRYVKANKIKNNLDFLIEFQFLPNVLTMPDKLSYPLLKMEWVRGKTIGQYLEKYYQNKGLLLQLADKFLDCVIRMQNSSIAHGDLSDGNVMITKDQPDIEIKLVDYDGIFIPDFAGSVAPEEGRVNYQHPARKGGKFYNKDLDNFSALVIYLTIIAIAEDPRLIQSYDEGLFIAYDFTNPQHSSVIKTLLSSKSGKVKTLTNLLLEALKHDPLWNGISASKIKNIP